MLFDKVARLRTLKGKSVGEVRLKFHFYNQRCCYDFNPTAQMAKWYGASASGAVDLDAIPSQVKPMTLKLVFTASLRDAQHSRESVENQPASLLVVPLGKALNGIHPILVW